MSRVDAFVLSAQLDLAADVLDAVTDIAPDDAEAWHQRAIVSFMQKDNRRALGELRRALSLDPRHYKAIRDLGMVLQQIGDKKGALAAYRQALKINPFLEQARQAVDELVPDVEGQDI
jgi:Flp pilus assembly protein TadD